MIIDEISKSTGLDPNYLLKLSNTANRRYKKYLIPKRGKGKEDQFREIFHPSKNLKFIQRWLNSTLFSRLPIHKSVYSYRENLSIRDIALKHQKNKYLLRIDFQDFFPSLKKGDIEILLRKAFPQLNFKDVEFITKIVCRDDGLTIGAPSSPILSNALLYDIDNYWTEAALKQDITYTRYADDLYFSCDIPNRLSSLMSDFSSYISSLDSPKLKINHTKSIFTSKKRKRMVTGLIITPDNKISIGRERKRLIRVLIHRCIIEKITTDEIMRLKGLLSFVRNVEPTYFYSLEKKYSQNPIFSSQDKRIF